MFVGRRGDRECVQNRRARNEERGTGQMFADADPVCSSASATLMHYEGILTHLLPKPNMMSYGSLTASLSLPSFRKRSG